ncbi:hypothetical protein PHO31112_04790 [Pandoraea horticolens]|uniref:Uncharacterized protein n=1 Tax=Pandoraea horticolens TaxID=2508298 RepID=A0A5E4YW61_9BURK|nr:hypothetical protein PHO31112_04790 [Pandoraea horticolens]
MCLRQMLKAPNLVHLASTVRFSQQVIDLQQPQVFGGHFRAAASKLELAPNRQRR